ncbi:MAG: MAPEG family protein [Parvibaculaceae bacterium]
MSSELFWLTLSVGLLLILWVPYTLARISEHGAKATLTYTADKLPLPAWAERAHRAHMNLVENLLPFAALILTVQAAALNNATTALWAAIFFFARLAHAIVHCLGIPFARTAAFAVGWLACLVLLLRILGA